jgi:hypothetical protein
MSNRLFGDLIFGHGRNDLVMHQQPIDVQRLVACRIRRLEFDSLAALGIFNACDQGRFEQFRFVPELLQALPRRSPNAMLVETTGLGQLTTPKRPAMTGRLRTMQGRCWLTCYSTQSATRGSGQRRGYQWVTGAAWCMVSISPAIQSGPIELCLVVIAQVMRARSSGVTGHTRSHSRQYASTIWQD